MNITSNKLLDKGLEIIKSIVNGQREQGIEQFKRLKKADRISLLRTFSNDSYRQENILTSAAIAHSCLQILLPAVY